MAGESLADRMLARAEADNLPTDHPLRLRAVEFDLQLDTLRTDVFNVKTFMDAWARARSEWCEYTGEMLI